MENFGRSEAQANKDDGWMKNGYTKIPNYILSDKTLKAEARFIYALLEMFNMDKYWCWPTQKLLAEVSGYGVKKLRRHLKALRDKGLIDWKQEDYGSNTYVISDPTRGQIKPMTIGQNRPRGRSKLTYKQEVFNKKKEKRRNNKELLILKSIQEGGKEDDK